MRTILLYKYHMISIMLSVLNSFSSTMAPFIFHQDIMADDIATSLENDSTFPDRNVTMYIFTTM